MENIPAFSLRAPSHVRFGWGCICEIGSEAARLGSRALVCIGRGTVRQSGKLDDILSYLRQAGVEFELFEGIEAEPEVGTVDRARHALRQAGCDLVAAIGGGSVIDVGKAVGALAGLAGETAEYLAGNRGAVGPGLPIIAAPTTAGTGAEVTPNSVLIDPNQRVKGSIRGSALLPTVALVDPHLTVSCPPQVTAYSGLDALVQALESYVSLGANPATDALALQAITLIGSSLESAYQDGANRAARERVAAGSLLAGLALANARLGLVHGLAHPVGAIYHIPHGQACAILMPPVMRFNLPCAVTKYARAARELGIAQSESDNRAAESLLQWFVELAQRLDTLAPLSAFGAKPEDFGQIIPPALASGSTKHNPRPVDEPSARAILEEALD